MHGRLLCQRSDVADPLKPCRRTTNGQEPRALLSPISVNHSKPQTERGRQPEQHTGNIDTLKTAKNSQCYLTQALMGVAGQKVAGCRLLRQCG